MYAMDHTGYQTAYGGAVRRRRHRHDDPAAADPGLPEVRPLPDGRTTRATSTRPRRRCKACGQPNGFETNIAFRAERPKEKATAEAFQQALARVGIKLTLEGLPAGRLLLRSTPASRRSWSRTTSACALNGWGADWNDGFGFLSQIVDSRVIRETGGSSNTSVRIPEVDKMLDTALAEPTRPSARPTGAQIDKGVMEEAVIYPGVYAKSAAAARART